MIDRDEVDAVLDQVGRGNWDAFRLIVRTYGLPLRGYIASQIHHPNDVDDMAQEVFLAAYRQLPSFRRGGRLRRLAPGDHAAQAPGPLPGHRPARPGDRPVPRRGGPRRAG